MMTSSNGNIFRVTGPLCGEFTGPGEFPTQRPVTRSFDVFFDLRLNKRLNKHSWGWWFEALSWSLWRHYNDKGKNRVFRMITCGTYRAHRKTAVTPLLTHWSYCSLTPSHRNSGMVIINQISVGASCNKTWIRPFALQWRHNERDGVSNHQPRDCLLKRLFRRRSKKTSKLRVTGLGAGKSPVTGDFPVQKASNGENVSIWWRHHGTIRDRQTKFQQRESQKLRISPFTKLLMHLHVWVGMRMV